MKNLNIPVGISDFEKSGMTSFTMLIKPDWSQNF